MEEVSALLNTLHYSAEWLDSGFLNIALLRKQSAVYQSGADRNTEHYRCAAFSEVLKARSEISDSEIAQYIRLAQIDNDWSLARAALCDLLLWSGLSLAQFDDLACHPAFAKPLFQKLLLRRRLLDALNQSPVTPETFELCLASEDGEVQPKLVSLPTLTLEQLEILESQGRNRAIRNTAKVRRQKSSGD